VLEDHGDIRSSVRTRLSGSVWVVIGSSVRSQSTKMGPRARSSRSSVIERQNVERSKMGCYICRNTRCLMIDSPSNSIRKQNQPLGLLVAGENKQLSLSIALQDGIAI